LVAIPNSPPSGGYVPDPEMENEKQALENSRLRLGGGDDVWLPRLDQEKSRQSRTILADLDGWGGGPYRQYSAVVFLLMKLKGPYDRAYDRVLK